ncbi:hypothetical protein HYH02_000673 [Chlamydomonas schloesseri]|uniref:Flavin-containing monooxygenase n=1 Tax=Chlamydomonas schloesseri TaxID=2026947 RepID=A0A835WWA4_9CHLO|nr:hypothetical protein HYH02_000673 [Chlamydomonas schloesseri]|eukprot:KAG2454841.1 hypothetical protein HYH02_000673 [Chlamydomonas schloesseri]
MDFLPGGVGATLCPPPERLRKILIVGAGVSGLQCARQFLKLGCSVLVLELNEELGGVWLRNYSGFGLQVPWKLYQFPEFPWPKEIQPRHEYPTGEDVQEYVRAYATHFDLRRHIRFNCKLLRLRWCPNIRSWEALYCDTSVEKFFKVVVDYAVICAGIYSQPYIPDYEGTDSYAGIQLHAKDFTDLSLARGRRVVIVGAGKTALDCVGSIVATNTAASVTLLYRQAHWPLPRRMLGTSVRRLLFNRAMTGMMAPYYTASAGKQLAARAAAPLKKLFWRSMERMIGGKFRITEQMRPRVHLPDDLFYGGQILDNTMDKLIRSEALNTVKGEINRFVRNGVILQDGSFVAADLVLYCTGYLKTYDYLDGDMRARLDLQKDGLYLYRNCLPYAVPHLAFIGSEVSTYNNILTQGLQALWLAHVLTGRLQLPSPVDMAEDVRAQQRWRRAVMPAQRSRGSVLMLYMMQYHDQLLEDMGIKPRRKGLNLFAECFAAYTAEDYTELLADDRTMSAAQEAEQQLIGPGMPPPFRGGQGHGHGNGQGHEDSGDQDGHGSGAYGHAANGYGSGAGTAPGRHGHPGTPRGNAGSGSYGTYSSMGQPGSSAFGDAFISGNAAAVAAASAAPPSVTGHAGAAMGLSSAPLGGSGAAPPASTRGTMLAVYAQRLQQDGYEYHRALMGEPVGSGANNNNNNSGSGGVAGLRTMSMSVSRGAGSMTANKRPMSSGTGLAGRQLSMSKGVLAPLAGLLNGSPHASFRRSVDSPHASFGPHASLALGGSGAPSASGSVGSHRPHTANARAHTTEGFDGAAVAHAAIAAAGLAGRNLGRGESPQSPLVALQSAMTPHEAAGLTAGGRQHAATTHGESPHAHGMQHTDNYNSPRSAAGSGKSATNSQMFLAVQQQLWHYNQQHHHHHQDHSRPHPAPPASANELHRMPPPSQAQSAPGPGRSGRSRSRAPPSPPGQHGYGQHLQGHFNSAQAQAAEYSPLPSHVEVELGVGSTSSLVGASALRGSQLAPVMGAMESGCVPATVVHAATTASMYTGGAPTGSLTINRTGSGGSGLGSAGLAGGNCNANCGCGGGSASRLSPASTTSRHALSTHVSLGQPGPQSPAHSHSRLSRNTLANSPLFDLAGASGGQGCGGGGGTHRPSQRTTDGGHQYPHSASLPYARSGSVGVIRTSQHLQSLEGMGSGAAEELIAEGEFVVVGPLGDDADEQDELRIGELSDTHFCSAAGAIAGGSAAGASLGGNSASASARRTGGRLPPPSPSSGLSRLSRLGDGAASRHTVNSGRGSTGGITPYDSSNGPAATSASGSSSSLHLQHQHHQQHLQHQLQAQHAYAHHTAIAAQFGQVGGPNDHDLAGQEHSCPPDCSPLRSGTHASHRTTEADGGDLSPFASEAMPSSCKDAVSGCHGLCEAAEQGSVAEAAAAAMEREGSELTYLQQAGTCGAGAAADVELQPQPTLRSPSGGHVAASDVALSAIGRSGYMTHACASEPSNRLSVSSRTSFDSRFSSIDVTPPPSIASIATGPGHAGEGGSACKTAAAASGRSRLAGGIFDMQPYLVLRTGDESAEQQQGLEHADGAPAAAQPAVDRLAGGAPVTPQQAQAAAVDAVGAGGFLDGCSPASANGYGEPTMAMSSMMMRAHSIPSTVSNGANSSSAATGSGMAPFGSMFPSESVALHMTGSSSLAGLHSDPNASGARALLAPGSSAFGAASVQASGLPSAGRSSKRAPPRHISGGAGGSTTPSAQASAQAPAGRMLAVLDRGSSGTLALAVVPMLGGNSNMVPASMSGGSAASSAVVLAPRSTGAARLQPGSGSSARLFGQPMNAAPRSPAVQQASAGGGAAGDAPISSSVADHNSNALQLSNMTLGGWGAGGHAGAGGSSLIGLSGGMCYATGVMSLSRMESLSSREEPRLGAEALAQ